MIDRTRMAARPTSRAAAKPAINKDTQAREAQFDETMEERAELQREANVLRDMMLAQLKADDEALKKYITMIS
jgi:hypothetical protein